MSTVSVNNLSISAIGDEDLICGLRLAGIGKCHMVKEGLSAREEVREALATFMEDHNTSVIIIMEEYAEYVQELLARIRESKKVTPVIVEVPSKFGTKHPDITGYYKTFIRDFIGFDIQI